MKSVFSPLPLPLVLCSTLLLAPLAGAATYYWDTNGTTAGLGDTAGTWGSNGFWGSMNAGNSRGVIDGTYSTANTTINVGDTVYFGTANLGLGSTGSTISIAGGGVNANRIVFGSGQGSQGVTLSGGGGVITLTNSSASIVANNTGTNTIGAVLAGTTGLIKGGPGTVLLTGANTFTGGVTVSGGGTLQVGNGTSGSLTSQNLTFSNGGGVFNARSLNTGSTQAMGALTFSATGIGEGTVKSTYGSSGNAELSFSSLAARGAGATGNFVVEGGSNGTTNKIVLSGASTGFLDKGLFFNGDSYAAYDASGYVRGLNYGSDANTSATDTIGAGTHVQLTSSPGARTGDTLLSLNLAGGGVDYTMNAGSLTVPAILKSGGGAVSTISGGTSLTTASNAELVIRTDTSSDLLTISTAVTGFSGGLTKSGEGTLTLSGSNGYTGTTSINGGVLAVSGGSAIADNQGVVLADAAGATLRLNSDETISNVTGGGLSGGTVDTQGNTLTLSSNAGYTYGGTFTGTAGGGVIKQGSGTLTLSHVNSYAGTFTVDAGTVEFKYGNDGTSDELVISSGGAFSLNNGTTLYFNPGANPSAGVIGSQLQEGNGFAFQNDINISSGTATLSLRGNDNRWIFSGNISGSSTPATPTTLAVFTGDGQDREVITFSGVMSDGAGGAMGLNLNARGQNNGTYINLTNSNTFSGDIDMTTTRNAPGYLVIGGVRTRSSFTTGTGSLGVGGVYSGNISITNTGAGVSILNYASSADQTLSGNITGAGGQLLKDGSGVLTLTGTNTYTGDTTVNAGSLLVNGSLGSSAVTVNGGSFGGSGSLGSTLNVTSGTFHVVDLMNALTVTGEVTLYAGFGVDDLTGLTWGSVSNGTYTLIDGTLATGVFDSLANNSLGSAFDLGGGRSAYFQEGSLQLVVIPEPHVTLLSALGLLMLLRRRR